MIKEKRGITLIALIITIIVLLILAGVTISSISSDDGILTKTQIASSKNKLSSFVEDANLLYQSSYIEEQANGTSIVTSDIINDLKNKGYEIESLEVEGKIVSGIQIMDENNNVVSNIKMTPNSTRKLKVSLLYNDDNYVYYVKIDNQNYQFLVNNGIKLIETPIDLEKIKASNIILTPSITSVDTKILVDNAFAVITEPTTIADLSEIEIASKGTKGTDEIKLNCGNYIFDLKIDINYPYAKDVLRINTNATVDYEKSPYVSYNGIKCRVLYDDTSEYGLQIISSSSIGGVTLGNSDFELAKESYNNFVDILNNKVRESMDTKGIATMARSMGTDPINPNDIVEFCQERVNSTNTLYNNVIANEFKNSDKIYEIDKTQIELLNLSCWGECWWPTRVVVYTYFQSGHGYKIYILTTSCSGYPAYNVGYSNGVFMEIYADETYEIKTKSNGVRGVFAISDKAVITSGNGTSESPYVLDI